MPIASAASCIAKPRPMQARWPLPNGFQALIGRFASAPRPAVFGSNRAGRGPHRGHRKAAADAGALAVAERLPGIDRPFRFGLAAEILRIERIGVRSPD